MKKITGCITGVIVTVAIASFLNWDYVTNLISLIAGAATEIVTEGTTNSDALKAELDSMSLEKIVNLPFAENFDEKILEIASEEELDYSNIKTEQDFYAAINAIGMMQGYSKEEKVSMMQTVFRNSPYKTDVHVPGDAGYVSGFADNGYVNYTWPDSLGFDKNSIKAVSEAEMFPGTWDRYGKMTGRNFSDVPSSGKYTYVDRAIPYMENEQAYHWGTTNQGSFIAKMDAIIAGDMDALNALLDQEGIKQVTSGEFKEITDSYNAYLKDVEKNIGSLMAPYGLSGTVAEMKGVTDENGNQVSLKGGAKQYYTPLGGNYMVRIGIFTEN